METYESYKVNADFDIGQANPMGCWEMKKTKDSTAKIVDADNGKALALSGTYSLKLAKILKNITAGDTYAENQVWEVDVTLPGAMPADGEVVLLDIYANKAKAEAGGFRIADGKIYYDNAGTYTELPGVNVSAGGKFKLQRTVDFNNKEAFTSTYTVYDASGKLLAQAKDIPMAKLELPVGKIGFSVTNMVGTSVQLDNLKLYVNGVGADLELYNAKTGIKYTDVETAKDSNTAYRFSWMNATASEKVYSIVAAFSNGEEKVIETVKMAPGSDCVNTGIVQVAAGQTVKIYARNDSKAEPENPNAGPGADANAGQQKAGLSGEEVTMLIVTIACAVVTAGMIFVAVKLLKKPAATKETKQEETEEKAE